MDNACTMNKNVNLSYWEIKSYFKVYDVIVIGSGIVGLSAAISCKQKNRSLNILVLERGVLPEGASYKNAGFACFGSAGELLDDLTLMPDEVVWETVDMRWKGLQMLRKRLGDKNIDYQPLGGFELFKSLHELEFCADKLSFLNKQIKTVTGKSECFSVTRQHKKNFRGITGLIVNQFEGQLDTSKMTRSLLQLAFNLGIVVINNINVRKINDNGNLVNLNSDFGEFRANKVIVATNGFTNKLMCMEELKPARAQVLVTEPIKHLKLKGAFHYQNGYYYFRNIDNRILFGGGRNLDFEGETTDEHALNKKIQNQLDVLLRDMILPETDYKIAHRWSGIMAVGKEKKPIVRHTSKNVLAAVRMGGMGVAIGTWVGEKAARMIL